MKAATLTDQSSILDELARLERNKSRRLARDKAKGLGTAASPEAAGSPAADGTTPTTPAATAAPSGRGRGAGAAGTTQRKCANCGQVGHIKTNKKLCPLCEYLLLPLKHHGGSLARSLG